MIRYTYVSLFHTLIAETIPPFVMVVSVVFLAGAVRYIPRGGGRLLHSQLPDVCTLGHAVRHAGRHACQGVRAIRLRIRDSRGKISRQNYTC